ncbi:putative protein N(5)-glutamine methyltransferase [Nocardiopsis sediminis]|uniref:peptide chain release factor N(5)-glutamine methyltransferase n=1 Tax=Nocardiopsis sediminis TaxID=1778267 RepID=A0ABV8FQS6_9ACTN
MPVSPSPRSHALSPSAIAAALRDAGCVFAEDEARLLAAAARTPARLAAMVAQRVSGRPLEHVIGRAEFCGLRIAVDPGVFVPRRRTEFLARQAVSLARRAAAPDGRPIPSRSGAPAVVDLCCGSGAVGVTVATELGRAELHAADIDPAAVRCARRNVVPLGGRVYEGDLYDALPSTLRGRVDVLIANVPYVPTAAVALLPPEARLHEPRTALDGGADGLDLLRRVAARAPEWLAPGGHLLVETGDDQAPAAVAACDRSGLTARAAASDDHQATVIIATRPGASPD